MATNKVFSGRKSAVMVRSNITPTVIDGTKVTGFPSDYQKYTVVLNNSTSAVDMPSGATLNGTASAKLPVGAACICNTVTKADGSITDSTWFSLESGFGAISQVGESAYAFDFIVPSTNSFDLSNTTEVADWISFGSVYRNKMPTIIDWSADSSAKVDFGDSMAQLFLYKAMLNQTKVQAYFYLGIDMIDDSKFILDPAKVTVFYGDAYITDFSIDASPDDVANVSISFAGDGELKAVVNGETIETDWASLL